VTYNTTIDQIRAWNISLTDSSEIYDGQILLVQMGATQPPPPTNTPLATVTPYYEQTPTGTIAVSTPTIQQFETHPANAESEAPRLTASGIWVGVIIILALAGGAFGSWVTNNRTPR